MAQSRPVNQYPCSQADLYAVCRIGWNSYIENQADFEAFNTLYTVVFGTDALAEIEAAVNLPGFQERDEAGETFHIEMKKAHASSLTKWKSLRSYIKHAYPTELHKPKIESAGYDHYPKAANFNWAETQLLLVAGQHFLDNNSVDLTTGGMPASFAAEYATATADFLALYDKFTDAEQDAQEATDIKVIANNKIYQKLMAMFEDAQIIYESNASKRERFVFAQVYSMITRPSNTNGIGANAIVVAGKVLDANTLNPIANASVNTTPEGGTETFSAVTGDDGVYEMKVSGLPINSSGTLQIFVEALDYEPTSSPLTYETGKRFEVGFELNEFIEPVPPTDPEPPVEP